MNSHETNLNKDGSAKKSDDETPVMIKVDGNDEGPMDIKFDAESEEELVDVEVEDKIIEIKESELEALRNRLEEEKKKAEDAEKKLKYVQADSINYKKAVDREKQEFIKYAEKDIIKDFLEIYDNFERAIDNLQKFKNDIEPTVKKGFEMIYKQTKEFLEKKGVKPIEAVGKQCDPYLHEVMMNEETDQHSEDCIIEEFRKGYYLKDKVLRTSFVKIAKPRKKESDEEKIDNLED